MPTLHQLFPAFSQYSKLSDSSQSANAEQVANLDFHQLKLDSRQVTKGDGFVLLKSQKPNTPVDMAVIESYLNQVADKAVFVLSEVDMGSVATKFAVPMLYLPNIREYLGSLIQANLQQANPYQLPTVVAVTGTNGKTTVSQLIAQLIAQTGTKTAVMGTAGNGVLNDKGLAQLKPATHTTGDALAVQTFLYDMASQGVAVLALEASSHGLHQHRLQNVPIQVGVYTNLSRDHLDYHTDMDDYAQAKAKLFDKSIFPSLTHAVINLDDEFSHLMIEQAKKSNLTVWTYSLTDDTADFFAKTMNPSLQGVDLTLKTPKGDLTIKSPLLGRFNVANLLASIAGAMALGITLEQIQSAVPQLQGATGRMDRVASQTGCFIVDYAHTPDALEQVLTSLRSHCDGELWAVFGCGGNRDKGKRPLMAQAGLRLADKVILTADNPRTEEPSDILNDMQAGMTCEQHYQAIIEPDRRAAIAYAVANSKPNDIVVIAGKGHETYQEINGVRYDFDDKKVVAEMVAKFGK